MGSTVIIGASRREVIDEITRSTERFYTIQHCCKGNVLYAVHESESADGIRFRFIGVHLLFKSSDGWGYKSMSEDMGPYNYTCPLKYLEMAPDGDAGSKNARDWRAEVRKQTADQARYYASGGAAGACRGNCAKGARYLRASNRFRASEGFSKAYRANRACQ